MQPGSMTGLDLRDFRHALGRFPTGVAVMTTLDAQGRRVGMTANSFASLSLQPPLILWSISRSAPSFAAFSSCDRFAVNVLACDQDHLSQRFSRPADDKFDGVECGEGVCGVPILDGCAAVFECKLYARHPAGDHELHVGWVERYDWDQRDSLVFAGGAYCTARPVQ
jgi:flavin reductase (DIM6/NTAB) family NADH-FMN oxidoreductase RutF